MGKKTKKKFTEQTGSAYVQPRYRMQSAEMITATEPSVSASTCKNMPCISGLELLSLPPPLECECPW